MHTTNYTTNKQRLVVHWWWLYSWSYAFGNTNMHNSGWSYNWPYCTENCHMAKIVSHIQNLRVSLIVMSKWPITYNQHMTNVWYMTNTWPILNRICKSLLRELVTLRIFYIIIPATNKQHRTDGFGLHHVSCWGGSSLPPAIAYVCPRLTSATWQGPNSLLSVKISAPGPPPLPPQVVSSRGRPCW